MTFNLDAAEARAFLPAKDFAASKAFYERLGFEKLLDAEVAVFSVGQTRFMLQNFYQKGWAENAMMQLFVDDLDAFWGAINTMDLPGEFGVSAPTPPALQPWGLRVSYLTDPSGVLWHLVQR